MEELLNWFSHHPLVAIAIAATGIVVALYFIRKHFFRILLVGILTIAGYLMYTNGFFSKANLDKVKTISFSEVESKTEKGLQDGFNTVKELNADNVEKRADIIRDETKNEMLPHLTEDAVAENAAAAPAAQKNHAPAAGVKTAASKKHIVKKEAPNKEPVNNE